MAGVRRTRLTLRSALSFQILAPQGLPSRMSVVDALSPVDGRYRAATEPLRGLLSEAGLIRERIRVEAQWLLHLSASVPQLAGPSLSPDVIARARQLAREPDADAALA